VASIAHGDSAHDETQTRENRSSHLAADPLLRQYSIRS
jgi:hypothetical protein